MKSSLPNPRQQLGNRGERLAAQYLVKHGYKIIERNFKLRYGELDIIALKDDILIIIEVKCRIGQSYGTPEEAVTLRKLREVIKTTEFYKSLHPELPEALRIDVVAIVLDDQEQIVSINHIENVTL